MASRISDTPIRGGNICLNAICNRLAQFFVVKGSVGQMRSLHKV